MRVSSGFVAVVGSLCFAMLGVQAAEPAKRRSAQPAAAEFTVGEPIRHANLAIFPIVSQKPRNADRFITLDEGLKAGSVEVLEASAVNNAAQNDGQRGGQRASRGGNSVNEIFVVNKSNQALYLMPGEIIIGGDQDRAIGQEYVIQPTKKPVPVEVFCVEQGRWGGRGRRN